MSLEEYNQTSIENDCEKLVTDYINEVNEELQVGIEENLEEELSEKSKELAD